MADIAVVSACYGNFDQVRSQAAQDEAVDWIMFTDGVEAPEPWRTVVEPSKLSSVLAAKWFKFVLPVDHRYVIWIDANMEVTSPTFAQEALAELHDGLALFKHPRRSCIYEEAEASLGSESQNGKYDREPIMEQVAFYRSEGHPEQSGLYACGTMAWDRADKRTCRLGYAWYAECLRWSIQDQLSFPVVARRLGIEPGTFSFPQIERRRPVLSNRWLKIHDHL